ncbi:MAG: TonB-dependent receptor plug domain-containing protein, partial [Acidobacteriota bacterium]
MQFPSPSVVLFSAFVIGSTCARVASAAAPPVATPREEVAAGRVDAVQVAAQEEQEQQQQDPVRVEESVVVTADREAEQLRDVGSSVSVISSDEIALSGARWLVDVLQFAPGVSVVQSGPAGSVTQVFLRGANSSHTLFLIDGVKVNSPSTGAYDTSGLQLAADQIERIEIVRGPQSALYGSQAVGGVINVITRSGAGAGTWGVEGEGGSFASGRVHTWGSGQTGNVQLIGGISYFDSDGYSTADERNGNLEPDGSRNLSYNGRLDYHSDGGLVLRGVVRGFDNRVEFDGYDFVVGPVDALRNVQNGRETVAAATFAWRGGRFASQAQLSLTDADLESLAPDDFYDAFRLDSSIVELDWQNELSLPASQTLTAGLEYRNEAA